MHTGSREPVPFRTGLCGSESPALQVNRKHGWPPEMVPIRKLLIFIAFLQFSKANVNPGMERPTAEIELLGNNPHNKQDLDKLSELLKQSYQEFADVISPESWAEYEKDIVDVNSRIRSGVEQIILRDGSKDILGCISLFAHADGQNMNVFPPRSTYVRLLAVHPNHRGRGLGKILMRACADRAKLQGNEYLVMTLTRPQLP